MTSENENDPEIRLSRIVGGPETEGIAAVQHIKADDLNESRVGRFLGFHHEDAGVNYQVKILRVARNEADTAPPGTAPGVSVWVRHPQVLDHKCWTTHPTRNGGICRSTTTWSSTISLHCDR